MNISNKTITILVSAILAIIPLMSIFKVTAIFILLAATLLMLLGNRVTEIKLTKIDFIFISILCLPILSVIISMLANNSWEWRYIDKYIRYPLGAFAFYIFLKKGVTIDLKILKIGFYLAAIIGFIYALYQKYILGYPLAHGAIFSISFGEIMTSIAIISMLKFEENELNARVWRILTFAFAFFASIMAGTKGAWIAYPFLLWIILDFHFSKSIAKQIGVFVISTAIIFFIFWSIPFSKQRIESSKNDVISYFTQEDFAPTSQGLRLMMWNTALDIYKENPIFGVGAPNVSEALIESCYNSPNPSIKAKVKSFECYLVHVHNDWLEALAGQGIGGLLSLILFAFFSTIVCFKNKKKYICKTKMWIYFNILINIGFAIFCSTQCLHFIPNNFWIAFNVISFAQFRINQNNY